MKETQREHQNGPSGETENIAKQLERANNRYLRERQARKQAETLLELRARELYDANERLEKLNSELEQRVSFRTQELEVARAHAVALAEHDQLTGLANRRFFSRQMQETLDRAKRGDQEIAFLAIDLDLFKDINDALGHHAGDEVLRQVASRLKKIVRPVDLVARLGGDEFAILCPIHHSQEEAFFIADKVIDAIEQPVLYEGKSLDVGCSIGIAIGRGDTHSANDLQRFADIALYSTKGRGRGDWSVYEDHMGETVRERQNLAQHLRMALELDDGRIDVRYQPILELSSGRIAAVEVLCRFTDPELGSIAPDVFIPVAEETALIYDLGDYVLNRSCKELAEWLATGNAHLAINLSPKQLKDRSLAKRVQSALKTHGIMPSHLCLEVTESLFLWDISAARKRLDQLSSLGIQIALDDFGTGFSNLSQLRFLPVDYLKIDRSFVMDIETDERALAMVEAILAVAKGMKIEAVAEGVENREQAYLLAKSGGELVQGYHFAKPLTLDEFFAFVATTEASQQPMAG